MLLLLLLLQLLIHPSFSQFNPIKLGCERIYGDFNGLRTEFKRPMEAGDRLVINSTVFTQAFTLRTNIHNTVSPFGYPLHVRSDMGTSMIYDAFFNGKWDRQEFSPQLYTRGQPYLLGIEYTGSGFNIYSGNTLVHTFALRTPSWWVLGATDMIGEQKSTWMEMVCKNPPSTVAPPTTRKSRKHRHRHHHRRDGGRGKFDSSSDSSSSSSQEFCD